MPRSSRSLKTVIFLTAVFSLFSLIGPAPGRAESPLAGTWEHQKDSGGWKVLADGSVLLVLSEGGEATLTATAPGQDPLEIQGTWSERAGRVTIDIPGQLEISNQPYKLQGDLLTLPSQLSSDAPGSSTWVRAQAEGMDLVFAAFNRAVEDGKSGATAAEEAAKEARKQEGIEKAEVLPGGKGLELTVTPETPSSPRPKCYVWFASKWATPTPPVQKALPASPLAADPRTHIDAKNPTGDPDAPGTRKALIVAPFYSKVYRAYSPTIWNKGDTYKPQNRAQLSQTTTSKALGDDPEGIAKMLTDSGYEVELLLDDRATPGPVFRALQAHPSIVYFSTHGGIMGSEEDINGIGVAGFLGAKSLHKRAGFLTGPKARERLKALLDEEGLPEAAREGVTWSYMDWQEDFAFAFPVLKPKFFEEALGKEGLPETFVFLDACYSSIYPVLAKAFKPRAFLGFNETIAGWASARFSKFLFSDIVRKGHSVREAWSRCRQLCAGARMMRKEDALLHPVAQGGIDLNKEAQMFTAWGRNQEPYDLISVPVNWLMRIARWESEDINAGAKALERCLKNYWGPGKRPGVGDQFCNSGILGDHTPTAAEVEEACHLICGRPLDPIGRFVLR